MPLRTAARKCPDATFLPLDTDAYDAASEEVMGLLRDFGHPVEVWGWDEAYVGADLDDSQSPFDFAQRILGDIGHHRSLGRFEDRIEIRLVKPVDTELPSGPVIF